MYQERASRLGDGSMLWSDTARSAGSQTRVTPDGCLDLIWNDGVLLVAGPDTHAHLIANLPGSAFVGLRFAPGTGPAVLGVPAAELRDLRVPLDRLWPGDRVRLLAARVSAAEPSARGSLLEAIALSRLADHGGPDPATRLVAARLREGGTVERAAAAVGLSRRQLHRRCLDAFGYGPKTLARVLRLDRALRLARSGMPLATVAATAGYADQPHLARDVKDLTGVPLSSLCPRGPRGPERPRRPTHPAGSAAKRSTPLPSGSRTTA
ncbi:helix-turn-helix transcriptional regulator [Allostreptomyces psammosilenae]|uniref:AraC-like DNA-binding protein n=1 Tax=Allostreptomyces psammosilenae TaxID=1892865 RepID=A0A852ZTG4_9ACTN|nr:helix-turn-helix transcriptional regulator [Allostreptomyces psammosilenae]NYI05629.1 AraC-like DNA-binding protein [Allostreptomyces psammosilenae]